MSSRSRKSKFIVKNKKAFIKCLCPNTGDLNNGLGIACQQATEDILKLIRKVKEEPNYKSKFSTTCGDNIYRTFQKPSEDDYYEFTIDVLNALLCWFFVKKDSNDLYVERHTKQNLENFFKLIVSVKNKKEEDRNKFNHFINDIELIKNDIAPPFNECNYELDENWQFSILENEEIARGKQDTINSELETSKSENLPSDNLEDKIVEDKKEKQSDSANLSSREKKEKSKQFLNGITIAVVITSVIVIFALGYMFLGDNKKEEKENQIIKLAEDIKNRRSGQLTNLFSAIEKELIADSIGRKTLSDALIHRINILSVSFKPYKYKRKGHLIESALSPERALLFKYLLDLNLSLDSYKKIFEKADFSFSDFFQFDMSSINMHKITSGVYGNYINDASIYVTAMKRPNLKYSDFDDTKLSKTVLYGNFSYSNFSNARIEHLSFFLSNLTSANFSDNQLTAYFDRCELVNSKFNNSKLFCSFENSDLRGVNFNNSTFYNYADYYNSENKEPFYEENEIDILDQKYFTFENVYLTSRGEIFNYAPWFVGNSFGILKSYDINDSIFRKKVDLFEYNLTGKKHLYNFSQIQNFQNHEWFLQEYEKLSPWFLMTDNTMHSYIIRTNDNYFTENIVYLGSRYKGIITNRMKETEPPKRFYSEVLSGKDFLIINDRLDWGNFYVIRPKRRKPSYQSTSFKNCVFNNITFRTKLSSISFEGSTFNKIYFNDSELYNIDLTKTNGSIFFGEKIKFDSLYVDEDFYLLDESKLKNDLKKRKELDKNQKDKYFKIFRNIKDRLIVKKNTSSNSDYIITDKEYLKVLMKKDSILNNLKR